MNEVRNELDYCGIQGDYLDGCEGKYPRYDYKGDRIIYELEGFAGRLFLPSQICAGDKAPPPPSDSRLGVRNGDSARFSLEPADLAKRIFLPSGI